MSASHADACVDENGEYTFHRISIYAPSPPPPLPLTGEGSMRRHLRMENLGFGFWVLGFIALDKAICASQKMEKESVAV